MAYILYALQVMISFCSEAKGDTMKRYNGLFVFINFLIKVNPILAINTHYSEMT